MPVSLFKEHALKSVPQSQVYKVLKSSATSGRASAICLDRRTARLQTQALASIMVPILGSRRQPMLIIDSKNFLSDRRHLSARAAGILGFSSYGRDHFFALNDQMELDLAGLKDWLRRNGGSPFFMFGFTFMVWQYFYQRVARLGLDLSRGTLLHGGGWKKLEAQAVSRGEFMLRLRRAAGLARIYNFYGMAEQVGSVFVECGRGYLHCPLFADVIIRDPRTWAPLPPRRPGIVQILSLIPESYPGHSLLSEDIGALAGVDGCRCGRKGKYFSITGRVPEAELRGCSDVHAFSAEGRP